MKKLTLLFITICLSLQCVVAQILPYTPKNEHLNLNLYLTNVTPTESRNCLSLDSLYNPYKYEMLHDSDEIKLPETFGISYALNYNFNSATWYQLNDSMDFCAVKFSTPNSKGIKLSFSKFKLTPSARMYLYNEDFSRYFGAYTEINNKTSEYYVTPSFNGSEIIVYMEVLKTEKSSASIIMDNLGYIFLNSNNFLALTVPQGLSDTACQINANCAPTPIGNSFCNEKRATVQLEFPKLDNQTPEHGGTANPNWIRCSGVLVNNSNNDLRPFVLTAHHCVDGGTQSSHGNIQGFTDKAIISMNYQSPNCTDNWYSNNQMHFVGFNVLDLIGKKHSLFCNWNIYCPDQAIGEITDTPRYDYNYFFAGWDKVTNEEHIPNRKVVGFHHPLGDIKKLAHGDLQGTLGGAKCMDRDMCWTVHYVDGGVMPGSSGSPLFDANHKVIGILSATGNTTGPIHNPNCVSTTSTRGATYGKLGEAWPVYQPFLDPGNSNQNIDGIDPLGMCQDHIDIYGRLFPGSDYQLQNDVTIQTSNTLDIAPGGLATLIDGSGITNANTGQKCDYTFQAVNSVKIGQGFKITTGNRMHVKNASCLNFIGCGFNHVQHTGSVAPLSDTNGDGVNPKDNLVGKVDVSIYPNPTKNQFTIMVEGNYKVRVLNSMGKVMVKANSFKDKTTINIQTWASGSYIIQLIDSDSQIHSNKLTILDK